ncbi:unnamed protein product, partial [Iphiclides podalirius]
MPRLAPAKVPPLQCESSGSSADGSSSEEAAGPYASEHSEPHPRNDDGYEADVEIGRLEASEAYKLRKLSDSMSVLSGLSAESQSPLEAIGAECPPERPGELAHPELCLIVVDILTQLIQKVVGAGEGAQERLGRVCVGLARALAARLAGGGAPLARLAGGGAPQGLLRRLLAPPAAALLAAADARLAELQHSVLELIHVVASQGIEPNELAALLQLFAADAPPLGPLLAALQRLVAEAEPCTPDFTLTFPVRPDTEPCEEPEDLDEESGSRASAAELTARHLQLPPIRPGCAARCSLDGAGWAPWLQGFALVLWLRTLPEDKTREPEGADSGAEGVAGAGGGGGGWRAPLARGVAGPRLAHVRALDGRRHRTFRERERRRKTYRCIKIECCNVCDAGVPTARLTRAEAGAGGGAGGGGAGGGAGGAGGGAGGAGGARVLCEARAACSVAPRRWACLALLVREAVLRRRMHIQVTFFLNGRECDTVSLPLPGILVRKATPTSMLLGQAVGGGPEVGVGGRWQLGGLSVYRSPALTAPLALHLAAHGPDHACQVRCEEPNFAAILTPEVLDTNVDWDQVFEPPSPALRDLRAALLLSFAPQAPQWARLHSQPAPAAGEGHLLVLPCVLCGRGWVDGHPVACAAFGRGEASERVRVRWAGRPSPQRHSGLAPALLLLGGPDLLLYLFARVVELGGSAQQQALALGVAVRAARADARLHAALFESDALDMLLPVLASPRCRLSHHMLKEILDVACSKPLLVVSGGVVRLSARTDCALLEPRLLLLLLRAWPHLHNVQVSWEAEGGSSTVDGSLWALALEATCALLRDGPRRAFNQQQAARADLLRHLLLACKERFLNSDCGPLSASASDSLVELVRALMGSPPLLCHLALLCDFLLLMHQASDTFVTHSRANFYFLLTSESPEASEFNFLNFMNKRKNKEYKLKRDFESLTINESVEDGNLAGDGELLPPKDLTPTQDNLDSDRTDAEESSADSTKEMKGIINAHLKEGRKENGIVPENNGVPVGSPGGTEGADALNGYVVVDEDELRHTTVEFYTSGIYHQRRVRAGAEPGWTACAGLLLLLRDALAALPDRLLAQVNKYADVSIYM